MDTRDFDLLQLIRNGQQSFKPAEGETEGSDSWAERVDRLLRLRDRGLIRMPDPPKVFMTARGGYRIAGPCEITADGRDAIERHRVRDHEA